MEATQHWLTCPTPGIYALGQLTRKASVLTRERGHASFRIVTSDLWQWPICRYIRMLFRFLRPGLLVYWPSWLKALAVKLSRPSGQSGSYTGLIWFNPRRLKKGDELPRNGPQYLCEIFIFYSDLGDFTALQVHRFGRVIVVVMLILWRGNAQAHGDWQRVNSLAIINTSDKCTWPLQSQFCDIWTYSPSLLRIPTAIFTSESLGVTSLGCRKSASSSSPSNLSLARLSNSFGRWRPT